VVDKGAYLLSSFPSLKQLNNFCTLMFMSAKTNKWLALPCG
jgi:hypothetical protein